MKEKEIAQMMQDKHISPPEAVELRVQLAGLYAFYSQSLEDILIRKPATWLSIRNNHGSDKTADRAWDATDDGVNEIGLTMRLKRIEKMMSALKSIIDNSATEYNYTK